MLGVLWALGAVVGGAVCADDNVMLPSVSTPTTAAAVAAAATYGIVNFMCFITPLVCVPHSQPRQPKGSL